MSNYAIYFSPTGGTKVAMQQIAKGYSEAMQEIDLSDRTLDFSTYSFTANDVCLIAVPSFGGRVPAVALKHLAAMQGGGAQAVLIVSFGNRAYDDTLLELQDAVNACGFSAVGAVAAVVEHSIMRQFGAGRPDANDCQELAEYAKELVIITQEKAASTLTLPGNRAFRAYDGVPFKPKANKDCVDCKLCAKSCPVAAIPKENPSQTNADTCISCMRCVAICPEKARSISKAILFVAEQKMKKACSAPKKNELFLAK